MIKRQNHFAYRVFLWSCSQSPHTHTWLGLCSCSLPRFILILTRFVEHISLTGTAKQNNCWASDKSSCGEAERVSLQRHVCSLLLLVPRDGRGQRGSWAGTEALLCPPQPKNEMFVKLLLHLMLMTLSMSLGLLALLSPFLSLSVSLVKLIHSTDLALSLSLSLSLPLSLSDTL